jgi:hypothetical protein
VGRHSLGEPALHPAGGDRDELGREGVRRRFDQEPAKGGDQAIGALGSV